MVLWKVYRQRPTGLMAQRVESPPADRMVVGPYPASTKLRIHGVKAKPSMQCTILEQKLLRGALVRCSSTMIAAKQL